MSRTSQQTQLSLGWFDTAAQAAAEEAERASRKRSPARKARSNMVSPADRGQEGEPMLLSVPEVARALRIGRRQAWEMVWQNKLPVVRLGPRTIRISRSELERHVGELSRPYGA